MSNLGLGTQYKLFSALCPAIISALTAITAENFLWPRLRAALIYGYKHKYVKRKLKIYYLGKQQQQASFQGLWPAKPLTFDQIYSTRTEFKGIWLSITFVPLIYQQVHLVQHIGIITCRVYYEDISVALLKTWLFSFCAVQDPSLENGVFLLLG